MPYNVNTNQNGIECSSCKYWIQIKCNGTSNEKYTKMLTTNSQLNHEEIEAKKWFCMNELNLIFSNNNKIIINKEYIHTI